MVDGAQLLGDVDVVAHADNWIRLALRLILLVVAEVFDYVNRSLAILSSLEEIILCHTWRQRRTRLLVLIR